MSVLYVEYRSSHIGFLYCMPICMYAYIYAHNISDIYDIWHTWYIYVNTVYVAYMADICR